MPWLRFSILLLTLFPMHASFAQSLRVMTYNIRLDVESDGANSWSNRKGYLLGQLRFYAPDIFGVQEALPSQLRYLEDSLPKWGSIGEGRDGQGKGEASNIFYRKDRFRLKASGTFWLSETPDQPSKGWDAALNRICTYGYFEDRKQRKRFWVFNTHLDHIGELARTKSIELILSQIQRLGGGREPVIFMGDFNSEPQTARVQSLKKQMDDAMDISEQSPFGPTGTFNGFRHDQPVTTRIDYIFVSRLPRLRVLKYAVLSDSKDLRYPSDHLPVFAEMELR